jgi:hypothetical protein
VILAKAILLGFVAFVATLLLYPRNVRTEHGIIVGVAVVTGLLVAAAFMFCSY